MSNKLTIYLAEDDEDDALFFKDAVKELMFEINLSIFEDGTFLMDHLESNHLLPDIIFLDLNMPKKDGMTCLKEIKANDQWKKIRTIVFTTSSELHHIKMCHTLGADLFITKPHSFSAYKNVIKDCLQS